MGARRLTPFELGINDANMKAAANTKYTSNTIDVREAFAFTVIVDITETGSPTAGDAKLTIRCVDSTGTSTYEVDAATAITTQTSGGQTVFTWGSGATATLSGNGTIGSNLDVLKVFDYMKVILEVTTQNDGTTSTADVTLLLDEV